MSLQSAFSQLICQQPILVSGRWLWNWNDNSVRSVHHMMYPRELCCIGSLAHTRKRGFTDIEHGLPMIWASQHSIKRRKKNLRARNGLHPSAFSCRFLPCQLKGLAHMGQNQVEQLHVGASRLLNFRLHDSFLVSNADHCCYSGNSFGPLFGQIMADIMTLRSFCVYLSVLALVIGTAMYIRNRKGGTGDDVMHTLSKEAFGLLIMNPTPFNRFVLMRCPSMAFEEIDADEGLSERLIVDDRHLVSLQMDVQEWCHFVNEAQYAKSRYLIRCSNADHGDDRNMKPDYQRMYLHADDGGVLAIDWPSQLDLMGEHGLDTAFLLIPGMADGSEDNDIRNFVRISLKHGYFPIILNPRGCADSLLTSPRIYTAADSDDVDLAVNFISKSRPWATLMAVGWGYGANMLVKYLGEEAETSPLTAAACIDNPFDLEEFTKVLMHGHGWNIDQDLVNGFVHILRANKMIFEGKKKEYDILKGLSSSSVREFDTTISCISHGFDKLEDFYKHASSEPHVDEVKVPLLCIQREDQMANNFSVLRQSFEENPFTTLLLSSSRNYLAPESGESLLASSSWCNKFIIEWFAAVELAFLKGRHPVLKGLDITIKPAKERDVLGRQLLSPSNMKTLRNQRLGPTPSITNRIFLNPEFEVPELLDHGLVDGYRVSNTIMNKKENGSMIQLHQIPVEKENQHQSVHLPVFDNVQNAVEDIVTQEGFGSVEDVDSKNVPFTPEGDREEGEAERRQVQQVAESVMNILDVTMPGALSKEKKKQVLLAVEKGETIVTALQAAVPEDVRGKMVAALSEAVHSRGIDMKHVGFGKSMPSLKIPKVIKNKIMEKVGIMDQGKLSETSTYSTDGERSKVGHSGDASKTAHESIKNRNSTERTNETQAQSISQKNNADGSQKSLQLNVLCGNSSPDATQEEMVHARESPGLREERVISGHGDGETFLEKQEMDGHEINNMEIDVLLEQEKSNQHGHTLSIDNKIEHKNRDQEHGKQGENPNCHIGSNGNNEVSSDCSMQYMKENETKSSSGEKKHYGQEADAINEEDEEKQIAVMKSDENSLHNFTQAPIISSYIGVQHALEALSGVDNATQMAVTNIFGVIENVIQQLEREQQNNMQHGKIHFSDDEHQHSCEQTLEDQNPQKRAKQRIEESNQNDYSVGFACQETNDNSKLQQLQHSHNMDILRESKKIQNITNSSIILSDDEYGEGKAITYMDKKSNKKQRSGLHIHNEKNMVEDSHSPAVDSTCLNNGFNNNLPQEYLYQKSQYSTCYDDVFLEYFPDENVWKFPTNNAITSENYPSFKIEKYLPMDRHKDAIYHDTFKGGRNSIKKSNINGSYHPVDYQVQKSASKVPESYLSIINEVERPLTNIEDYEGLKKIVHGGSELHCQNKITMDELIKFVHKIVMHALKLEVLRKVGLGGLEKFGVALEEEVLKVSDFIAEAVKTHIEGLDETVPSIHHLENHTVNGGRYTIQTRKIMGVLNGEAVVSEMYSVISDTNVLGKLIPIGVLVGVILATLDSVFHVMTHDNQCMVGQIAHKQEDAAHTSGTRVEASYTFFQQCYQEDSSDKDLTLKQVDSRYQSNHLAQNADGFGNDTEDRISKEPTIGEVVDVMSATADLAAQVSEFQGSSSGIRESILENATYQNYNQINAIIPKETCAEKGLPDNDKQSIISSFAEKAMSVAAPVVPTKLDGEIDHERLVAVLADLGNKGGGLKFIGKAALLWGGLRGAMSLTERLLVFLHISERPLHQRITGFILMVLLLWSPVLVPLLPSLLQQWATQSTVSVAKSASVIGLYSAVVILVTIWGQRIRGFSRPLSQYGLNLFSKSKILTLATGLVIGFTLIPTHYVISHLLGFVQFTQPERVSVTVLTSTLSTLIACWKFIKLIGQAFGTGLAVSIVEELLFRSWLHEEIAVDLGYHKAVLLSGLAFSVIHWSLPAVPGLWLLSIALSAAKARSNGNLSLPIGIHTGIISGNYIFMASGLIRCSPCSPSWFASAHVGNPLAGVVGLFIVGVLALILYP